MLTRENLEGVWAAIPTPWDENINFDEKSFRENVHRYIDAGVHGIYTTDSTGEFYALDFEEYKHIVDVFAAETDGQRILTAVGCTWLNTRDTIRRLKYAADKGVDGAHVTNPFWIPLAKEAYLQFWRDVSRACPGIGLVHYNTARSGHLLRGADYSRLTEAAPNLVGTKFAETDFGSLMGLVVHAPELSHFAHEGIFTPAMMAGARGIYSWLVSMSPQFMLNWYEVCRRQQWDDAMKLQRRVSEFQFTVIASLKEAGYHHAIIDKALAEVGGFLKGSRRTRAPYQAVPDEEFCAVRRAVEERFPDLLWRGG